MFNIILSNWTSNLILIFALIINLISKLFPIIEKYSANSVSTHEMEYITNVTTSQWPHTGPNMYFMNEVIKCLVTSV
jgi:hypothetical protein